jgi:hypothetical protein
MVVKKICKWGDYKFVVDRKCVEWAEMSSKRVCAFPTNPFSDGSLAEERVPIANLYITDKMHPAR